MELGGNKILHLEELHGPYIVISGSLSVFALLPEGSRLPLFLVKPGEPLFPTEPGLDLLAIALEDTVLQETKEHLERQREAATAIWARKLEEAKQAAALGEEVESLSAAIKRAGATRAAADASRFAARRRIEEELGVTAMDRIAGVLRQAIAPARQRTGDLLLDAVRAVASAQGIRMQATSSEGELRSLAQRCDFRTRMVVLSGVWWQRENGPILGFWRQGRRPVAILPAKRRFLSGPRYEIFDPANGTMQPVTRISASMLDSLAYVLYRPLPADLSTRGLLTAALREHSRDLRLMIVGGLLAMVLGLAAPEATAILIGQAIPDADRRMMWEVALGTFAAAVGAACFLFTQAIATMRAQSRFYAALQTGVWDHLLKLGPDFFRRFTAGELRLRADAITRIQELLTADAVRAVFAGLTATLTLVLMFAWDTGLGSIAFGFGLLIAGHGRLSFRQLRRLQRNWQSIEELLSGMVLQLVNAVTKLRVAGAAKRAFAHWAADYSRKQALSIEIQAVKDRIRLFHGCVPPLAFAASFFYLLSHPGLPIGTFLAYVATLQIFLTGLTNAVEQASGLILIATLWTRVRTILDTSPELDASKRAPGLLQGRIHMNRIQFRYTSDGPLILDGITIRAEPGECIALTGPSGCGKSTLLNLLLRFETPQSGGIFVDGQELAGLDIAAVRRQIGVVMQDGRLMAQSIFENICAGGKYSIQEVWDAATAAGLREDIERMPMGLHTVVSEGGGNLSGGQRQRLLIARALILKPAILVFDEATSALDNRSQATVTRSLEQMTATRILVAHRLSTIQHADRIYVLDQGRVVQEGTYQELATQPGLFARLLERQKA